MPDHAGGESFVLEIVATKSSVPVYTRLKGVCKRLLRAYDFRLTRITETTPRLPGAAAGEKQKEGGLGANPEHGQ